MMKKFALLTTLAFGLLVSSGQAQTVNYQIDNNNNNQSIGLTGSGTYDLIWLNTFPVQSGGERITNISAAFGRPANPDPTNYNGLPVSVLLYQDPDGGSPTNAVKLQEVNGVISNANTGLLVNFSIPATDITTGNFVIGVVARNSAANFSFLAGQDTTATLVGRSFIGFTTPGNTINVNNLASIPGGQFGTIEGFGLPGNWVLRATGVPVPEPTSMALVGLGAAGFAWRRWRRK